MVYGIFAQLLNIRKSQGGSGEPDSKSPLSTCERQVGVGGPEAVVDVERDVSWQAAQHDLQAVIGQPRVAPGVQDEEVGGVGHQLAGLIHPGDGGGGVGANQCKEHQGDPGVWGLAVVGVDSQNLWLDCERDVIGI